MTVRLEILDGKKNRDRAVQPDYFQAVGCPQDRPFADWQSTHHEGMAKHVADAGSYAPVTVLVDERADGVHFSYDKMTSLLAPYENREALEVARDLDRKFEDLLRHAATGPPPE